MTRHCTDSKREGSPTREESCLSGTDVSVVHPPSEPVHRPYERRTPPSPVDGRYWFRTELLFESEHAVPEVPRRSAEVVRLVTVLLSPLDRVLVEQLRGVVLEVLLGDSGEFVLECRLLVVSRDQYCSAFAPVYPKGQQFNRSTISVSSRKNRRGVSFPSTRSITFDNES